MSAVGLSSTWCRSSPRRQTGNRRCRRWTFGDAAPPVPPLGGSRLAPPVGRRQNGAMTLELRRFADVDGFMAVAGDFLEAREAEHNLIFGICSYVRDQPNAFGDRPPYFAAVVVGRACRRPPRCGPRRTTSSCPRSTNPPPSTCWSPTACTTTCRACSVRSSTPGPSPSDGRRSTGARRRHHLSERIFRLRTRDPGARRSPVGIRIATPDDRDLVAVWLHDFMEEALGEADPAEVATGDRPVAGGPRPDALPVGGRGHRLALRGGRRDPERHPDRSCLHAARRLVAAAMPAPSSPRPASVQLDAGRRFCFLFTDLANPDVEPHLPGDRLRAGARRGRVPLRRSA